MSGVADPDDAPSGNFWPWHRVGVQPAVRQLEVSAAEAGGTMTSSCEWLCEMGTCRSGCGLVARSAPADSLGRLFNPYRPWNHTSGDRHRRAIGKRVFSWDKRWNAKNADEYMVETFSKGDDQFETSEALTIDGNMATVSREKLFTEGSAFQLGSGGLHGCTVMTLVSKRAAYMAHYWEVYALGASDDVSPAVPTYKDFQIKVLNAITGGGEQDPITVGGGVTWEWYNQPGDQTRLILMTPARPGWTPTQGIDMSALMYPNKVAAIASLVRQHIPGVQVRFVPYRRLNYRWNGGYPTGQDAAIINKSARGMAFFQYDGTFDGAYWRLMYEYTKVQKGDSR
ncbi:hypothetical protein C8A00DRAFT_33761 [Chaetomidium leptoderma]|uniref:Uncharacterized protein n=1 Tax=Chaetomidium leptoderma TaxID=669021 RepID=A0AAN6ZYE7_9PEZI|nr:hypothetical protein C8A00DRAFT_33761 [Chaetomidium leptoderma]